MLRDCPDSYARLCAEGWDTVQEAIDLAPTVEFVDLLEKCKRAAIDVQDDLEGFILLDLGGERLKCLATGAKGGFRWRLECDDYLIMIGSPKRDWTVSARYLSAGLWEHGLVPLRERVFRALRAYTTQKSLDCVRVSRADFCFDFHSPVFSKEFTPGLAQAVVAHASVKTRELGQYEIWSRGAHGETLSIGSKSGLQNQLYDKSREIDQVSGKTWLYEIWRERLRCNPWGEEKPRDVWRLECRFASEFLKERNIRRPFELMHALAELLAEALFKRRLTVPNDDCNRWRWPLHPIWSEAYRQRGAAQMVAIGRKVTGRRSALLNRALSQIAGAVRSAAVLSDGTYDQQSMGQLVKLATDRISADPKHEKKVDRAMDRYSDVEAAR